MRTFNAGSAARIATRIDAQLAAGWLDEAAALAKVRKAGQLHTGPIGDAPRGAIMLWSGGKYGHAALSLGGGKVASTDVNGPGTVGTVPAGWFATRWPHLRYAGWTRWWGTPIDPPTPDGSHALVRGLVLPPGVWTTWHRHDLTPGVHWALGVQLLIPARVELDFRLARIGWGPTGDNGPGAFGCWFPARRGQPQAQTRQSMLWGGGPVEWQLRAPRRAVVPVALAKWHPDPTG